MSNAFIRVQSAQKDKTRQRTHRTALSLFIGGLFCSAAPAWANCVNEGTNANGGLNITCDFIESYDTTWNIVKGSPNNNVVIIQGDFTSDYNALGAYSDNSETLKDNSIIMNGSTFLADSISGATTDGVAIGNSVTMNDSSRVGRAFGANALTAIGNSITLNDNAYVFYDVLGAMLSADETGTGIATATGNSVTMNNNSHAAYSVYGASSSLFSSPQKNDAILTDNSVILNDVSRVDGFIYGGRGDAIGHTTVNGNAVTLNNSSSVNGSVYGGYSQSENSTSTATGNKVNLNGSSSVNGSVYGGYSKSKSSTSTATDNKVNLNGSSSVNGSVYGGYSQSENSTSTATGNKVNLNGSSSVNGSVYGGYGDAYSLSDTVYITENTVNINDNAKVTYNLYGGFIDNASYGNRYDAFSGNTLNFAAAPITLSGEMANFENYNFTVDPALVNTDTALITANTITFGTNVTNMKGGEDKASKIQVVGIKAGNELFADDKFVLMKATGTMSGEAKGLTTHGVAQQGISLLYDIRTDVVEKDNLVTATIIGKEKPVVPPVEPPIDPEKPVVPPVEPGKPAARVNPQLKALSEGHLASAMMLTRGADTLAYNTVHTIQHQNPNKGLAPFITLSGGKTRYNSGSHIDAKDGLLTGGLGYQTDKLTSAVLIESGWGSYTTHNGFDTMNNVNGDGHNRYVGGAVIGHYDFDSGIYAEASLRAGKNRNTFDTKDIVNLSTGEKAHYNLDSNYLGAHIGTGYSKALDEKNTADVSAKYLWTQLKGKNVTVAGDNIHFDDINSHRVRLDAGLSHKYTDAVALRAGLGYEYEFDGKAAASTYGYGIGAPSVQGSTAIMTVGATVTPMANQAFTVDVNASGYTGQRDGIGGNIKFSYAF